MAQGEARRPKSFPDQEVLRLEGNLEALPCAAVLIDLDDLVLDCNALATRLFPLAAIGHRFTTRLPGARPTQLDQAVEQVRRGGERRTIPEITFDQPGEAVVIARVTVAPVSAQHRVVAVLVTAEERTDVASLRAERDQLTNEAESLAARHQEVELELATAADELRASNEELTTVNETLQAKVGELEAAQTSDRKKTEFLALLAHELRNPLESILTAMHVIRLRIPRETDVDQARRVVERQVKHLARMLEDLLDVSRIQRGRVELRKEMVDVAATAAEALEDVRHLFQSAGTGSRCRFSRSRSPSRVIAPG
jgi:signal transduction histidine kinase